MLSVSEHPGKCSGFFKYNRMTPQFYIGLPKQKITIIVPLHLKYWTETSWLFSKYILEHHKANKTNKLGILLFAHPPRFHSQDCPKLERVKLNSWKYFLPFCRRHLKLTYFAILGRGKHQKGREILYR